MIRSIPKSMQRERLRREKLRAALVRSLLIGVDPDNSLLGSTLAFVDERLARIRGVARFAVLGVEQILSATFAVATGAPCVSSPRAEALLRRLDVTTLPVVADYVRLVRSLVLIFVYETRPPIAEEPS
jgi:hypothetical protein